MSMNEADRVALGQRIRRRRELSPDFNTRKAAYTAARVNQETWRRAEAGEFVRDDKLRQIVRALWPHTEGDWTLIDDDTPASLEERQVAFEERVLAYVAELQEQLSRVLGDDARDDADDDQDEATTA